MFTLRAVKLKPNYVTYRERYKVDLSQQMAKCESNYFLIKKLCGNHLQHLNEEFRFMISHNQQQWLYILQVIESSRYTTTLQFNQIEINSQVAWLQSPRLTLRLYHDAKLAEVLAWEGHKRFRPRYDYPNLAMFHADEKMQINQFLGELLARCLRDGHRVDEMQHLLDISPD